MFRIIIRLSWLISTPILLIGNRNDKSSYFSWWLIIAIVLTFFNVLTVSYFLSVHYEVRIFWGTTYLSNIHISFITLQCGFLGDIKQWFTNLTSGHPDDWSGVEAVRFVLFISFFDGGLVFLLPTVILISIVHARKQQIEYNKREHRLLDTWSYELTPFRIPRARINLPNDDRTSGGDNYRTSGISSQPKSTSSRVYDSGIRNSAGISTISHTGLNYDPSGHSTGVRNTAFSHDNPDDERTHDHRSCSHHEGHHNRNSHKRRHHSSQATIYYDNPAFDQSSEVSSSNLNDYPVHHSNLYNQTQILNERPHLVYQSPSNSRRQDSMQSNNHSVAI